MKKLFTHLMEMKKKHTKYLGILAGVFLMVQQSFAVNYVVTTTADLGAGSFRQAITDANNNVGGAGPHTISFDATTVPAGSTIDVSSSFASGTGWSLRFQADITVNAPSGGITLNGTLANSQLIRIDASRTVVFNNMTFKNTVTSSQWGGGFHVLGTVTLNNCTVSDCTTTGHGKAVHLETAGVLNLNNSLIKNNTGSGTNRSGAIYVRTGTRVAINNSILEGNSGETGGAIYFDSGAGIVNTITNSIIRTNTSTAEKGGGIAINTGTVNINNSEISGNIAQGTNRGGGIGFNGSAAAVLSLTNSTISGNSAGYGGGIYVYSPAVFSITNTTFSGNSATVSGGGMETQSTGSGTLNNCTFTLNNCTATADGSTGGFSTTGSAVPSINYCLFAGNTTSATTNATRSDNINANFTSGFGGNVIGSATPYGTRTGVTTGNVLTAAAANTILSATLADNGGQVSSVLPNGTYTKTHALVTGSVAIDRSGDPYTLATDQRGYFRGDGLEDAGSFEFNGTLPVAFNGNFKASIDGNRAKLDWSVSSETNNNYFLIEKSLDGKIFTTVTKVSSKGSSANAYVTYDNQPASGINYYRLSQVDLDGTTVILSVKSIKFALTVAATLSVYPNPTTDQIFVNLDNYTQAVSIGLIDSSGKTIYSEKVNGGLTNYQLKLTNKLASGIYILSLSGEGLNEVKKVIVQ